MTFRYFRCSLNPVTSLVERPILSRPPDSPSGATRIRDYPALQRGYLSTRDQGSGHRYPMIAQSWRDAWQHVIPFLAFPPDVSRVVFTTNTIEALHRQIRKTIKTRGHVPTEEAATKLIYLSIQNAKKSWRQTYHGSSALLSFEIHFGNRLP